MKCRLIPVSYTHLDVYKRQGLLSSDVASGPIEKLFIDYLGPFPRSKSGNSYLLVCVDAFSKFAWLLALRQANARLTITALQNNIFQHFGLPTIVVSDNGQMCIRDR